MLAFSGPLVSCSSSSAVSSADLLHQLSSSATATLPSLSCKATLNAVLNCHVSPLFCFFFFWVTGELPILRQQEAAADARRT